MRHKHVTCDTLPPHPPVAALYCAAFNDTHANACAIVTAATAPASHTLHVMLLSSPPPPAACHARRLEMRGGAAAAAAESCCWACALLPPGGVVGLVCCTSRVTRHASHVTRHTSHVTRHTSHVTKKHACNTALHLPPLLPPHRSTAHTCAECYKGIYV